MRGFVVAGWLNCVAVSCVLISPVDEVTPTRDPVCSNERCADAAAPAQPADDASLAEASDDAGAGDDCRRVPDAPCNPVAACGCESGLECRLEPTRERLQCLAVTGLQRDGEVCSDTRDCASGLGCSPYDVCSPYCVSDADCAGAGLCLSFYVKTSGRRIAGAGWCTRWCDLGSGEPCLPGSSCTPAVEGNTDLHAACTAIAGDGTGKARGETCMRYDECAPRLGCSEYGPPMCTPFCAGAHDCPADAPYCYEDDLLAAPNTRVGQCIVWPCVDASLPDPPPWTQGPVWTAQQLEQCKRLCGQSWSCIPVNCQDGERFGDCVDVMRRACAGAKAGPCRAAYVEATCCPRGQCDPAAYQFDQCAREQVACQGQAERACADLMIPAP